MKRSRIVSMTCWCGVLLWCVQVSNSARGQVVPTGEHDVTVFLSEVGTVGGGVALENPTVVHDGVGGTGTLYVWVDPQDVVLSGMSLRALSVVPGVIRFDEPVVYNPDILFSKMGNTDSGFDRWNGVGYNDWFGTRSSDNLTGEFLGVAAFQGAMGIQPEFDGSDSFGTIDSLYDADAGTFLFAEVGYDVIGFGATPVFLEIGEAGVLNEDGHTSEVDVFFGDGELVSSGALNAWSQRLVPSALPDAIINVFPGGVGGLNESVPEPGSLMLAVLGIVGVGVWSRGDGFLPGGTGRGEAGAEPGRAW